MAVSPERANRGAAQFSAPAVLGSNQRSLGAGVVAAHPSGTTFDVLVGMNQLLTRAHAIDALLRDTDAPATARWGPLLVWLRSEPRKVPWVVVVYRGEEMVAAALLVREQRGVHKISTMGERHLPSWLPARDPEAAVALAEAITQSLANLRRPWVLHLNFLDGLDAVIKALKEKLATTHSEYDLAPRLNFGAGHPLNSYLSRNTRSALAKARNRIGRAGLTQQLAWTSDVAEIDSAVPEILDLYQRRTIELNQDVSLLADIAYRRFFTDMAHAYAFDGLARLVTLRLDGMLASYAICLKWAGTVLVYSNRMAPEFGKYSAGALTNAEVVRACHADPSVDCVDWGNGIQRYKLSGDVTLYPYEHLDAWSSDSAHRAWLWTQSVRRVVRHPPATPVPGSLQG